MHEDPRNIGRACDDCAPKPNPVYFDRPLESFVGSYCKLGFPVEGIPNILHEHLWVHVDRVEGNNLVGRLSNDPVFVLASDGDIVTFDRTEIEDVLGPEDVRVRPAAPLQPPRPRKRRRKTGS